MPICIAGMHRSGTSMITRLLNCCGLYLGKNHEIMKPNSSDNTAGYWENLRFVSLNESILIKLADIGCTPYMEDWEKRDDFNHLKKIAVRLINENTNSEPWGWKDPRNTLTISFWREIIPDLKTVFCLRNPFEVAKSLEKRGLPIDFSLNSWVNFNKSVLHHLDKNSIITHYDSYFEDAKQELKRVLNFIGLYIIDDIIDNACNTISKSLRHHLINDLQIENKNLYEEVMSLYILLGQKAGPVYLSMKELS